jgi:hypothetical protein
MPREPVTICDQHHEMATLAERKEGCYESNDDHHMGGSPISREIPPQCRRIRLKAELPNSGRGFLPRPLAIGRQS